MKICSNKECPKAGIPQELTEFHKNKCSKDGLQAKCKPCHSKSTGIYAKRDPEKHRAQGRKWIENNREKHNARGNAWEKAHPEYHRNRQRDWQRENPDKVKLYRDQQYQKNMSSKLKSIKDNKCICPGCGHDFS